MGLRVMRSSLAATLLAVLSLSTPLRAATVQLDLAVDPAGHAWQVFAEVQGGSMGLDEESWGQSLNSD
jgi:hypothetical protein